MRRRADRTAARVLCLVLLLSGCAAKRTGESTQAGGDRLPSGFPSPSGKCIFLDTVDDWKAVDPFVLLVRTRATGWQWRITLARRCPEILRANALKWDTADSRVCDSRADAITLPMGRCTIGSIEPYEPPPRSPPPRGGW